FHDTKDAQTPDRLAQRGARDAEAFGQLAFRRKLVAGFQGAGRDHRHDALRDLFGHGLALDGLVKGGMRVAHVDLPARAGHRSRTRGAMTDPISRSPTTPVWIWPVMFCSAMPLRNDKTISTASNVPIRLPVPPKIDTPPRSTMVMISS